jgi:hypothetical protein
MFYGPRGNGKVLAYQAIEQISEEFFCLFFTFQQGFFFKTRNTSNEGFGLFWRKIKKKQTICKFAYYSNSNDFDISNKELLFENKKVIFIDLLYYSKDEFIIDDVLNVLRRIKHTKDKSSLHSFVARGPF